MYSFRKAVYDLGRRSITTTSKFQMSLSAIKQKSVIFPPTFLSNLSCGNEFSTYQCNLWRIHRNSHRSAIYKYHHFCIWYHLHIGQSFHMLPYSHLMLLLQAHNQNDNFYCVKLDAANSSGLWINNR